MKKFLLFPVLCCLVLILPAFAQTAPPAGAVKTFTGKNISFDYPADWNLVDKTVDKVQQFNMYPSTGNVLIMVIAYQISDDDGTVLYQLKSQLAKPRISSMAESFTNPDINEICYGEPKSRVSGQRISGLHGTAQSTADSYSFFLDKKYINLVYMKENKDNEMAEAALKTVFDSLRVKHKISDPDALSIDLSNNDDLGGRALFLPHPPASGGGRGKVKIEVTIDEAGNVIAAKSVLGNLLDVPASIAAAKKAKFTPTCICGENTKVTGYIIYHILSSSFGS